MMMISSTEAVTTAKANNIIANLRNLKTAALAWYMDSIDQLEGVDVGTLNWNGGSGTESKYWHHVKRYMANSNNKEIDANYALVSKSQDSKKTVDNKDVAVYKNSDTNAWFVVYYNHQLDKRIQQKLKGRAKSVGLLREASPKSGYYGSVKNDEYWIFMRVK